MSGPLMSALGSLSRLTACSVEQVQQVDLLLRALADMSNFARCLCVQWRLNKLSEIDHAEEPVYLNDETMRTTLPRLWRVLRSSLFSIVTILRALLGRVLNDPNMPLDKGNNRLCCRMRTTVADQAAAPFIAAQTLHILRNLYFISSRTGTDSFSQYSFIYFSAIDIISQYPLQSEAFLTEIRPISCGTIPQHPLDRCHDLYFLNTAEHFTLVLSAQLNEDLLIGAATPYLGINSDRRLYEIFEAAHSVMLAVLSAPQNAKLSREHIYSYVQALFEVFPLTICARQFRLAIKTLIRMNSPPYSVADEEPLLPSTLLELVRSRLQQASTSPLPPERGFQSAHKDVCPPSEQSTLELALIDSLPYLPLGQLDDWASVAAGSLRSIQDPKQAESCKERFWEVLSNGEMDVDRASRCVTFWGTRGGRAIFMKQGAPFMSGALVEDSKL